MKIAIFGAGAVGGHFGARLAEAGHQISLVVRGDTLQAVRANGLTLELGERRINVAVAASDAPEDLGVQDLVISTLKSNALGALAAGVEPLLGPATPVIFAQNGIPWWYAHGLPPASAVPDLGWLDPGGLLERRIGLARTIGGVITSSNEVIEPGVIHADTPDHNALAIGRPDRTEDGQIADIRAALTEAGLSSPTAADLREPLWRKLVANMTVSVLCMITGQTAREAVEGAATGDLVQRLLGEAVSIAAAQGFAVQALPPGARAPDHKPSLLQDYARGRPVEIDALVRAPVSFARAAGLATPVLDTLGAVAEQLAVTAGLYTAPRAAA